MNCKEAKILMYEMIDLELLSVNELRNVNNCLRSNVRADILMEFIRQEELFIADFDKFHDAYGYDRMLEKFKNFVNQQWVKEKISNWNDLTPEEKKEWLEE